MLNPERFTRRLALAAACAFALTAARADFYKRPIGPRGLEATQRLLSLAGSQVRITGFLVQGQAPGVPAWIVAPVPVHLSDEDEALADDLPASVAYLHEVGAPAAAAMAACRGAVSVSGQLQTGPQRESDDRISYVRVTTASVHCVDPQPIR
jgi:hypothetical protein